MKTFLITFNECDYDQYDGFVVVANNEEEVVSFLKAQHPNQPYSSIIDWKGGYSIKEVLPEKANKTEIILSSFNAG